MAGELENLMKPGEFNPNVYCFTSVFKCGQRKRFESNSVENQEKIRGQRGTLRALAGICQFHKSYL